MENRAENTGHRPLDLANSRIDRIVITVADACDPRILGYEKTDTGTFVLAQTTHFEPLRFR